MLRLPNIFRRLDRNHDGVLDLDEFSKVTPAELETLKKSHGILHRLAKVDEYIGKRHPIEIEAASLTIGVIVSMMAAS